MNRLQVLFFLLLLSVGLQHCTADRKMDKTYCPNSISIEAIDAQGNNLVDGYELYETTNYAEGIIMDIGAVSSKYRFKDSARKVCIPILPDPVLPYRKFVFVKNGYVYTEYQLKNSPIDTVLQVVSLK
jgi:hypothetical protein